MLQAVLMSKRDYYYYYHTLLAGPTSSVFTNISSLSYSNSFSCSFLNNQSFYCVVCCNTDPSVPPDSSVYNISTTRGTEVSVFLQGLTSGQMYYCKAAATNISSASCTGPVVGGVKMYFSFVASLPSINPPTTCRCSCSYMSSTHTSMGVKFCLASHFPLLTILSLSKNYFTDRCVSSCYAINIAAQ